MPDKHALLGPSGATRWMACPASARMEETQPDKSTIYSAMGTVAHGLAELKLNHILLGKPKTKRAYNANVKKLQQSTFEGRPSWDDGMDDATDVYVQAVQDAIKALGDDYYIAIEERVDLSEYIPESFGTADCILIGPGVLHIIDYKNGTGVAVSSDDNPQMQLYALGAVLKYQPLFDIQTVRMTIVQPNLTHNHETVEMAKQDLLDWAETVREPARKAFDGVDIKNPGDHCRFCKAQAICPAYRDKLLLLEGFTKTKPTPDMLTDDEAGEMLIRAKEIDGWIKKLEAYITDKLLDGQPIKGWKVVEGRSNRTFADITAAFNAARSAGIEDDMLYERKPITLTALEKIMGKPDFNDAVGPYVIKPQGKPTLAPETDKRQPFNKLEQAQNDFATDTNDQANGPK